MPFSQFFEHLEREPEIYRRWEQSGAFRADPQSSRPPFSVSMPPPNATGTLHLGHAIMLVLEDIMTRFRRMAGDEALWLPGTDHAAIATESVVIKILQSEGIADPRGTLGREELVLRIAEHVERSRNTIRHQIRAMGASCDWSRERYTMDPQLNRCVNEVFGRMFRDGLIYRGARIVNWDPGLQTTVSDDEIEHREQPAKFYTLRYGPVLVGTSRPETKLGDTAIAVHPNDPRYRDLVGKTFEIPWPKGPTIQVRVIEDEEVDPELGTGVLGVTPGHSQVDYDIAQRHGLPLISVIGEDGRMTAAAGPYAGLEVGACREAFVADLEAAGLIERIEEYPQRLSICYRSKRPIEPLLKAQWFIDVSKPAVPWGGRLMSLRQVMREVVDSGAIRILPKYKEKDYFHWIDKLRDWCISRQIWWGHQVPVWYRGEQEIYVGHRGPEGLGWVRDTDTLDTWFSSALWTWSTLIDPVLARDPDLSLTDLLKRSPDFGKFHPTSVMETGYDILFFWVARMILMTTYVTGDVPFRTVYLHGLILDRDGEKMTKSKPETIIDPLATIETHGTDALRLALIIGNAPGQDFRLSQERIEASRGLVTKLWNAAKLVERTLGPGDEAREDLAPETINHPINRWMLVQAHRLVDHATSRLNGYVFGDLAEQLRATFWTEFCDVYLEAVKVGDLAAAAETRRTLHHVFGLFLRLFHPFMPFVTEELWTNLGHSGMLIGAPWPDATLHTRWSEDVAGVEAVVRVVTALRRLRVEAGIPAAAKIAARVEPLEAARVLEQSAGVILRLANLGELTWGACATEDRSGLAVDPSFRATILLGAANREAETSRLEKQLTEAERRLAGLRQRLADPKFRDRARPDVVANAVIESEKLEGAIASIRQRLEEI